MFKITIHMVASVDGMIAKKDNSISWFNTAEHYEKGIELSGEETEAFLKTIDCYVMGARTYKHALELSKSYGWAYGDTPTIVLTHQKLQIDRENIEVYSGELIELVEKMLKPRYENVWVVGGAMLVKDFIRLKLADEIRLSLLPIILGEGLAFFDHIEQEQLLRLKDVVSYKTGMVELRYEVKKD